MTAEIIDPPTIHKAMAGVLADLPAIGKNQRNQQQGFSFRGIDDVLDALNPVLAKHGVFFMPEVLERLDSGRTTGNNKTMWVVNLHVRYRFYGPRGDFVEATGWGEGTDMGDKATQKAMTGALKYVLFQVFAIATHEQADADSDLTTPEPSQRRSKEDLHASNENAEGQSSGKSGLSDEIPSPPPSATSKNRRQALKARCVALTADGISVADEREARQLPIVDSCDDLQLQAFETMVSELEEELSAPFAEASK
jgi:hypothetical protein